MVLCSFGIVAGNAEAEKFFLRIGACIVGTILVFLSTRRGDTATLRSFLLLVFIVAICNALVVIITAIFPGSYEVLQIEKFSGFDKRVRALRSPGLFRGYDTSGAFMSIALAAIPISLSTTQRKNKYIVMPSVAILALACTLSSRTSMLVFIMTATLCLALYKGSCQRYFRLTLLTALIPVALFSFYLISVSFSSIPIFPAPQFVRDAVPQNISLYYNDGVSDYLHHHILSDIRIFPIEIAFLPDNFYSRAGHALGAIGLFGALMPIAYMSAAMVTSNQGNTRRFCIILIAIFITVNFKNNYFFFLPFFTILCFAYSTREVCAPRF